MKPGGGKRPWAEVDAWRVRLHKEFDEAFASTKLPERPDYNWANEFLLKSPHPFFAILHLQSSILARPRVKPAMPSRDQLAEFTAWCAEHITGDEKGQAQVFLDRTGNNVPL
jgi:hypothetical protein